MGLRRVHHRDACDVYRDVRVARARASVQGDDGRDEFWDARTRVDRAGDADEERARARGRDDAIGVQAHR